MGCYQKVVEGWLGLVIIFEYFIVDSERSLSYLYFYSL